MKTTKELQKSSEKKEMLILTILFPGDICATILFPEVICILPGIKSPYRMLFAKWEEQSFGEIKRYLFWYRLQKFSPKNV